MRITTSVVQPERLVQTEERKRLQLRKEAEGAYKKQAQYFQPAKNAALAELQQLLQGNSVKDKIVQPNEPKIAHLPSEQLVEDEQKPKVSDDTLAILESIRQAALAPKNPTAQDLKVAESAVSQIAQTKIIEQESKEFDDTVHIPEHFTKDVVRDAQRETIFGRNLEDVMHTRLFNKAIQTYATTYQMVANGYKSFQEPKFSQIA